MGIYPHIHTHTHTFRRAPDVLADKLHFNDSYWFSSAPVRRRDDILAPLAQSLRLRCEMFPWCCLSGRLLNSQVTFDAWIPLLNPCNISVWKTLFFFVLIFLPLSCFFTCSFLCNCTNTFSLVLTDLLHLLHPPRVQQSCPAFRFSAARAVLRGLPYRPAVSRKWCHNDWERKLWPNGWQNLRRRPFPDGEHQLLSSRCLQDHVTKVKSHYLLTLRWMMMSDIRRKRLIWSGFQTCGPHLWKKKEK